ncbi:MAG: alpha/beta hydrolase fold domain-containing protein [Planctomycetaceae bacterium]
MLRFGIVVAAGLVFAGGPSVLHSSVAGDARPQRQSDSAATARENGAKEARDPVKPTQADVRYGPYDRNLLDLYQAETAGPAPVVINFHGGGFLAGDKAGFDAGRYLHAGISVISANYRFTAGTPDAAPYPAPMHDGARVVQFVRSRAREWKIDPERIALTGVSAGAIIDMWVAYHDDLARPDSPDPVERYSTRVACLMPEGGPTTLDPELILRRVGGPRNVHTSLLPFFDIKSLDELASGKKRELMRDASPITHVSRDDPPTYLFYSTALGGTPLPPETKVWISIHHAEFGAIIKEKLDTAGVENVLQSEGDGKSKESGFEFLIKHLQPAGKPKAR